MFRKEFIDIITHAGVITLKSVLPLTIDKRPEVISELELLKLKDFNDKILAQKLLLKYKMTFIDLTKAKIPGKVINLIRKTDVVQYRVIPIQKTVKVMNLVTFDPSVKEMVDEIRQIVKYPVDIMLTTISAWKQLFDQIKESVDEMAESISEISTHKDDEQAEQVKEEEIGEDIIFFVNKVLADSYIKKASDIHFEPYEKKFRIRYRIDGSLIEEMNPPRALMLPIISRIKIMAQMDIAERRLPQDGRIKIAMGGRTVDYRVSSLPTLFGEKIVMRILDSSNLQLDMTKLGFAPDQITVFKEAIHKPFGMCLVTGPTGSGKTTTLYSALSDLNKINRNISTVEDPVEFNLEGINQVNVRQEIGLTFASALKSFLRQDPDIIMVGEIRDSETGEIAIEAALTGHIVLSTLHTNDSASTITRLLNMGIEPFLVVGALNVVVAQRLCRKICNSCRTEQKIPIEELVACGLTQESAEQIKVYHGKGCKECNMTGYSGRVAIYEVLKNTPKISTMILSNPSSDDLKRLAISEGMRSLRMSALTKVAEGLTTIEEAVSVSSSDD